MVKKIGTFFLAILLAFSVSVPALAGGSGGNTPPFPVMGPRSAPITVDIPNELPQPNADM